MKHSGSISLAAFGFSTQLLLSAFGQSLYWDPIIGGNGHYYEPIPHSSGLSWAAAKADAEARGGYLATITSSQENAFVFGLIDSTTFWSENLDFDTSDGPWIGGFQINKSLEPNGNFAWVSGEPFTFSAWFSGQPDDSLGIEDHVHYWTDNAPTRSATWNDVPQAVTLGYVVEYNAVPEPSSYAACSVLALAAFAVYRRTGKHR